MKCHHIKISFHNDHSLQASDRFPCKIQRVQHLPFLKQGSIWRIQILRSSLAKNTPSKPDDPLAQIRNREHHTVAETVIGPGRMLARHRQSSSSQIVLRKALLSE